MNFAGMSYLKDLPNVYVALSLNVPQETIEELDKVHLEEYSFLKKSFFLDVSGFLI